MLECLTSGETNSHCNIGIMERRKNGFSPTFQYSITPFDRPLGGIDHDKEFRFNIAEVAKLVGNA
jgi:hypothetical protein